MGTGGGVGDSVGIECVVDFACIYTLYLHSRRFPVLARTSGFLQTVIDTATRGK